jgi:hypothetical protein
MIVVDESIVVDPIGFLLIPVRHLGLALFVSIQFRIRIPGFDDHHNLATQNIQFFSSRLQFVYSKDVQATGEVFIPK